MGPLAVLPGLASRSAGRREFVVVAGAEDDVLAPPPRVGTTLEDLFLRLEAYSLRDIFFRCCWRLVAEAVLGLGLGCLTLVGGGRRGAGVFAAPAMEDSGLGEERFAALRGATRLEGVAAGLASGAVVEVGVTTVSDTPLTSELVWMPSPWFEALPVAAGI
jgi:hypothetical protein